jgi:GDP-L-fucose synthase
MPTNLYGPNDNYNLANSHVLPAMIRKFHLGKCLGNNDWESLRHDLRKRPVDGIDGNSSEPEIIGILDKYGIKQTTKRVEGQDSPVSLELWGTGQVSREFMHVDDMAAACIYIMQNTDMKLLCLPPDLNNCFINIGTGEELTVAELAGLVQKITAYTGVCNWDHSKPDGIQRKLLDCTKLRNTGFKPTLSLEDGIRAVYSQYCGN